MKDENSAHIHRSARSDPSGSRAGFELGGKLRARMEKLEQWRIPPSLIKSPKDVRQFHGGHAAVSKAFLLDKNKKTYWMKESYNPREVLQLCRQSDDHIRGALDDRRDDEWELTDEEKYDRREYGSYSNELWWGEFVAIKKLRVADNTDIERILGLALRETELLVELDHRNIVKIRGFVEDLSKDIIWLVFHWAENGNLKDFAASRDWEIPERISLIDDVASGLEYLHRQEPPICHGDLKSYNVLVSSEHRALITDFGSARRLTELDLNKQPVLVENQPQPLQAKFSTLSKTITLTGNIYTLRWAAPELLNDDQISLWSDIWALGWIAYEVLTNSIPFQDVPADAAVIERVINGDLPSINEHARVALFENLCSLMTMCWNSNPSERPTAKDYVHTISDMPMVIPETPDSPDSSFSETSSSAVLMERGRRGWKFGDSVMTFACFTEALRIYTKIGDRAGRADALCGLADVHRLRHEYSEAIVHYSEALQILTDLGDRAGRADALWGLADMHRHRLEYSLAITHYSEALQICTDIGDRAGRADALWGLADVHRHRHEFSEAIAHYSEALQICTVIGDRGGRADALCGIADVHRLRHEYSEAIAHYSEALQIRTDLGDRAGRADPLWGLADVHRLRHEYSEAIAHCSEALQIRTDIGDRAGRADVLCGLADVHRLRHEYSEGIAHYSEALQIRTDLGDSAGRAGPLWGLGEVHRARREYGEAIALYSEVLQICTDTGDKEGRASALRGLAELRRARKEYNDAIALYSEVLRIRTDIGDREGRADALLGLANLHRDQDHHNDAASFYQQAAEVLEQIGRGSAAAEALKEAADVRQLAKLEAP